MSETKISDRIALGLSATSKGKIITWRNNTGNGVSGKILRVKKSVIISVHESPGYITLQPGDYVVKNGRRIQYGLCVGSSDRIGVTPTVITPRMVGQTIGVFTAIEVKTPTGRASEDQENFMRQVRAAGGFAGVARNVDEAVAICQVGVDAGCTP